MSLDTIRRSLDNIPDNTVFSLGHDDFQSFVHALNSFLNQVGVGIHPHPSYLNNLILRADGASITADFVPGGRLVATGTNEAKFAIGCIGKGAATQEGTAEFFSRHGVSWGTGSGTLGYRLQVDGSIAKLYHGEEQVWIGEAKGAHGLDGSYDLEF